MRAQDHTGLVVIHGGNSVGDVVCGQECAMLASPHKRFPRSSSKTGDRGEGKIRQNNPPEKQKPGERAQTNPTGTYGRGSESTEPTSNPAGQEPANRTKQQPHTQETLVREQPNSTQPIREDTEGERELIQT